MKVGILTYHFANNYGAILQAFAMQEVITSFGIESEIINFIDSKQESNNSLFESNKSIKNIIRNIVRLPHLKKRKARLSKFNKFRIKYLNISKIRYDNLHILIKECSNNYDMLIVGSDQVWNPNTQDFSDVYFKISDIKIPVITYAASIGNACADNLFSYIQYIKQFRHISLREQSGNKIIKELDKYVNVENVMDPTLLISSDRFLELGKTGKRIKGNYILCYYLGRKKSLDMLRFMMIIQKKYRLPVYFINASNGLASYKPNMINDAGPEDFISLINDSKIIFTNSFHATAIAIKLGIPFYNFEEKGSNDNRKQNLLNRLGIKNRAIYDFELINAINFDKDDILEAQRIINLQKDDSIQYVINCFAMKM